MMASASDDAPIARPLLIGVGNRDRGDDGIGVLVVEACARVLGSAVVTLAAEGDLSDLALRWTRDETVVVVDAMVSGRAPGSIVRIDAIDRRLPVEKGLLSSHGIGLGEAVELARLIDRLPRCLTVFCVEATSCGQFDRVTPAVEGAVDEVVMHIIQFLDAQETNERGHDRARPVDA
jgi:hydrogenase maturation protease